jgi:hypothetical protein
MATASVDVGFRPIRVGFLVRGGAVEDIVTAARLNTLVWGGIFNPIIAVGKDTEKACDAVSQFELDVLHRVVDDPLLDPVVERFPFLQPPPDLAMRGMFEPAGDDELGLVDIRRLVDHYYERFVTLGGHTRAVLPQWPGDDPLAALFAVAFGEYGSDSLGQHYMHAFRALQPHQVDLDHGVATELLDGVTPIRFTADRLRRSRRAVRGDGLVLGNASDPLHLTMFWNLRSTGALVAFWPLDSETAFEAYCLDHLHQISIVPRKEGLETYLWRCGGWPMRSGGRHEIPEAVQTTIESVGSRPVLAALDDLTWKQPAHRPAAWSTRAQSVLATVEDDRFGQRKMILALPEKPYESERGEWRWRSHWLTTVSTIGEYDYPGFTIRLPSLPDLNVWASESMAPIRGVRLGDGAISMFSTPRDTSLELRLVEESEVIRRVLARAGIAAEMSPAGEAAARIIRQMGGLGACRVFRLPGVRALIQRSSASYAWRDAVRTIEDHGSFARYRNVSTAAQTFRSLLEKGVFQAALRIKCEACRIHSRYSPEALATEMRCPRCGTTFALAPVLIDSRWEYQTSGFFAHHNEHGALPVILTMLRLDHNVHEHVMFQTASHQLTAGELSCETDVLALVQQHDGTVCLAIGECKGGGQQISGEDVANLARIAATVRASGLECYLVFSTTRERFGDEEIRALRQLVDPAADIPTHGEQVQGDQKGGLILLTWNELRSFDLYPAGVREFLPKTYPVRLSDLAANAAFLYLSDGDQGSAPAGGDEEPLLI